MRICFFSRRYFPAISGMSVYAQNLLRELVALGHEVTMISQYRGDETGTRVYGGGPPPPVPGVRVIGLEALGEQEQPVANFERDIETMVQTAVAEHARAPFDLLHAQYGYPTGLAALETSKRLGLPNVVSIQGGDGHWVGVNCCETHREAMRVVLDHAGALLIGSRSFAEEVRENHGTPPGRFTVVPGAVDATRFRPREDWRTGEWIDPAQPTILYHGRVDRRKGALDLLDAFATLRRRGHALAQRTRLLYSGIGPDSAAVAERVQALGLDDAFTSLGYVDYADVPAVYRRADLVRLADLFRGIFQHDPGSDERGSAHRLVSRGRRGGLPARRRERPAGPARRHPLPGRRPGPPARRRPVAPPPGGMRVRGSASPVLLAGRGAADRRGVCAGPGNRARQRLDPARSAGPGLPLPRRAASALKPLPAMPTALFLSPHLDDVAFSCGGTLLRLTDDPRWRVALCTIFTASVPDPQGFALRCQTDKGIPAEVDYMALRRAEDAALRRFRQRRRCPAVGLSGGPAPRLRIPGGSVRGCPRRRRRLAASERGPDPSGRRASPRSGLRPAGSRQPCRPSANDPRRAGRLARRTRRLVSRHALRHPRTGCPARRFVAAGGRPFPLPGAAVVRRAGAQNRRVCALRLPDRFSVRRDRALREKLLAFHDAKRVRTPPTCLRRNLPRTPLRDLHPPRMNLSLAQAIDAYRAALPPGRLLEFALTPLDRLGVPVQALTLLPLDEASGSVLSWPLCEGIGYGETPEAARVGAYGELTEEVSSSAALTRLPRLTGSCREMLAQHGERGVVDPVTLCLEAGSPYTPDTVLEWVEGRRWSTDEPVLIPAEFVACAGMDVPPRPGVSRLVTPITNGHGAGTTLAMAQAHGLLELLQRDGNSVHYRALAGTTAIDLRTITDPAARALLDRYDAAGIEIIIKVAATDFGFVNLYVVGYDRSEASGGLPVMAAACGEAVHPLPEVALRKALLEFASSRARLALFHGPLDVVRR